MGLTVPGYYLSRKKAETFTESMEAELTANLEQPVMILKDKIQATGRRVMDGLDASKPPNNELKCNAQNSINCEAESTVRDINFGAENTLKLDMNAEPLIDPEHHEFQMHSITINTQLATPPNYEELNTQSKDNNWALKTQNNSKTTYLCLGELNTCATKEETCNEKLSDHVTISSRLGFPIQIQAQLISFPHGHEKYVQQQPKQPRFQRIVWVENVEFLNQVQHPMVLTNDNRLFKAATMKNLNWRRLFISPARANELHQLELSWFGPITCSS